MVEHEMADAKKVLSAQQTAERELRASEQRYRLLVENARDVVLLVSTDGIVKYCSPSMTAFGGYDAEEEIGRHISQYFADPSQLEHTLALIADSILDREFRSVEFLFRPKAGDAFWVEAVGKLFHDDHQEKAFHCILRDITGHKRAQDDIQSSETRYRRLFEAAKDGILILDAQTGKIVDVNPFLLNLTGYTREDFLSKHVWEIGPFKDIASSKTMFEELQEKKYIRYDDLPLATRDGRRVDVEFVSNVYISDHQNVVQCNIRDITERKRTERVARVRPALLEFASTHSVEELIQKSLGEIGRATESPIVFYNFVEDDLKNPRLQSWSAQTTTEFHQTTGFDIHSGNDDTGAWAECMRLKKPVIHNADASSHDGDGSADGHTPLIRELVAPVVRKDKVVAVMGVRNKPADYTSQDVEIVSYLADVAWEIVQRKLAEEALRESREILQAVLNSIPVRVFWKDKDLAYLGCNAPFARDAGFEKPEDLTGKDDFAMVWRAQAGLYRADDRAVIESGVAKPLIEEPSTSPSGEIRYLLTSKVPLRNAYGDIIGILGTYHDITDFKRAGVEKIKLEEQLRQSQKLESIGRLAGGVAHDFNNLLQGILGFSEIIKDSLDVSDPLFPDVSEVIKAAESAAGLTKQLLAFSRKQIISPKIVDLNELIEHSKTMLSRLIGEDIDLAFIPHRDLWLTKADPTQIDQILINLAVNSRDAMPDGGKLTIETRNVIIDEEYCRNHANMLPGEFVMLAVSDNGVGMDQGVLDEIFEPFFTTKEKSKGTGLGLSTVYGIVKQHGGSVFAYSEPGEGTSLRVYLPKVTDQEDVVIEKAAARSLAGTETVLLVEDQDVVRRLALRVLEQNGYRVLEAENGSDAFIQFEDYEGEIHLLLTDVVMPNMNGKELYHRLTALRPGIKVVYMSGYTDDAIAHRGVLDPGTFFLPKPFKVEELLGIVRDALDADAPITIDSKIGTMLLIEDQESTQTIVHAFLEDENYKVISAARGEEGIRLFQDRVDDIDLVLLGQTLPDLNGSEIFQKLCELRPDVPVVMVSGHGSEELSRFLKTHTRVGLLLKPFRRLDLLKAVKKALPKRR